MYILCNFSLEFSAYNLLYKKNGTKLMILRNCNEFGSHLERDEEDTQRLRERYQGEDHLG